MEVRSPIAVLISTLSYVLMYSVNSFLVLDGLETKPVFYNVEHGSTLRVRVFMGVTSDSRAHLERIMTHHGDPEVPELRT